MHTVLFYVFLTLSWRNKTSKCFFPHCTIPYWNIETTWLVSKVEKYYLFCLMNGLQHEPHFKDGANVGAKSDWCIIQSTELIIWLLSFQPESNFFQSIEVRLWLSVNWFCVWLPIISSTWYTCHLICMRTVMLLVLESLQHKKRDKSSQLMRWHDVFLMTTL